MRGWLRDTFGILVGNALLAFAYASFAVPAGFVVGGVTGIGLIMEKICQIDYAFCVFGLNFTMLVLGYVVFGKKFVTGTILSSLSYPLFLALFQNLLVIDDAMLSAIYAGVLAGTGLGIVFHLGYSTGGLDIPCLWLSQKASLPLATVINGCDALILVGQLFFANWSDFLYGLLTEFITTGMMKRLMLWGQSDLLVAIVTDQPDALCQQVRDELHCSCRLIHVLMDNPGRAQPVLICMVQMRKSAHLYRLIAHCDSEAVVLTSQIHRFPGDWEVSSSA